MGGFQIKLTASLQLYKRKLEPGDLGKIWRIHSQTELSVAKQVRDLVSGVQVHYQPDSPFNLHHFVPQPAISTFGPGFVLHGKKDYVS